MNTLTHTIPLLSLKDTTYLEKGLQELIPTYLLDAVVDGDGLNQNLVVTFSELEDVAVIRNLISIKIQGAYMQQQLLAVQDEEEKRYSFI